MKLCLVDEEGEVLAQKKISKKKPVDDNAEGFIGSDKMMSFCDKLIRSCELIGENKRTGETKVMDTPEEAREWERQVERVGLNMIN